MNNNLDLVGRNNYCTRRIGQTPTRSDPIGLSYCPRMVPGGNWLGETRAYANKIRSKQCDLNLGVVLTVENDGLLGFCKTNNRTDLFQLRDILGHHHSS